MATISSHVLDSVIGTHAAGIRVQCFRRDAGGANTLVFDQKANEQGLKMRSTNWFFMPVNTMRKSHYPMMAIR